MDPPDSEHGRQHLSRSIAVLGSCKAGHARWMRAALFARPDGL